jgi:hypothetical protein
MALTSRFFCLALAALSAVTSVYGTQVMHRPAGYKNPPNQVKTNLTAEVHHIEKRATGKVSMAVRTNVLAHCVMAEVVKVLYELGHLSGLQFPSVCSSIHSVRTLTVF